jgi:hypothetical protein
MKDGRRLADDADLMILEVNCRLLTFEREGGKDKATSEPISPTRINSADLEKLDTLANNARADANQSKPGRKGDLMIGHVNEYDP